MGQKHDGFLRDRSACMIARSGDNRDLRMGLRDLLVYKRVDHIFLVAVHPETTWLRNPHGMVKYLDPLALVADLVVELPRGNVFPHQRLFNLSMLYGAVISRVRVLHLSGKERQTHKQKEVMVGRPEFQLLADFSYHLETILFT